MPVEAKPLFRPDVLRSHLQSFLLPARIAQHRESLDKWATMFKRGGKGNCFNEKEILPDFLADIFCGLLGYHRPHESPKRFTFSREKHVEVDGKVADAVLGNFRGEKEDFVIAVEGKGPLDPLDRPFKSRKISAVEQGYGYAINLPCDWIIVTSMRETRLYFKGADQHTFERFLTEELAENEAALKKFVFLLGAERAVPHFGRSHLFKLRETSEQVGREVTREFYDFYSLLRHDTYIRLCQENPRESRHAVLAAAQMLLDRVLFCCFCQHRGLLKPGTVQRAYEHRDPFNPRPVWDNFKGLFRSVDVGNQHLEIPPYNGGLFAPDEVLERLAVPDELCEKFKTLSEFDFRRPADAATEAATDAKRHHIDVEILGHIFEQSITDLEQIRNELDGLVKPAGKAKQKTRRKAEGAFYTPAFITRYIVEQTLGGVLADRFDDLWKQHAAAVTRAMGKLFSDPRLYDVTVLTKPQRKALIEFWQAWQDELGSIRVLDPACGSGAFLIEAFDQLHAAYRATNSRLEELTGHAELFDLDRQILHKNLYGVDLNEEAIEICRLSLWIKTAQHGKKLTSLDHSIRVGNSVVADPSVHSLAFDWQAAFPEVFPSSSVAESSPVAPRQESRKSRDVHRAMDAESTTTSTARSAVLSRSDRATLSGFDVVVGNPPYIRQEWLAPFKPYWEQAFQSYHGVADIFTYFYELGVNLLRPRGRLGFITSGSWVRGNFGAPLRAFLSQHAAIDSMVDFGEYQPFDDAEMIRPTITVLTKPNARRGSPDPAADQDRRSPQHASASESPGDLRSGSGAGSGDPRTARGRMKLFKWLTTGSPPQNLSEVIAKSPTMRTDHLSEAAWELDPDDVLALRAKLKDCGKPLASYCNGIFRGVVTGLNEVFVINRARRDSLISSDPQCAEIIKPFVQGTHLRPWYLEQSDEFLIFTRRGTVIDNYPAVREYLESHRKRLEPRPDNWPASKEWGGRKPGAYRWYELQDTVDYWKSFEVPKIVWPDISKLPRFSMDSESRYLGNTAFVIPGEDYFLLGILQSWATWFFLSKTAQPLRLRGDRWQYRLFAQFMEHVPIPNASKADRKAVAELARRCTELGQAQYQSQTRVQHRLTETFAPDSARRGSPDPAAGLNRRSPANSPSSDDTGDLRSDAGAGSGDPRTAQAKLNQKATAWWDCSLTELGDALKTSFDLTASPFKTPRTADEWEPYLAEHRAAVERQSRELAEAETELNARVFRLFNLAPEEIQLLQREVEH